MLRITGTVKRVDHKSGTTADRQTGEARDWSMDVIRVLVADQAITEVTRFGDLSWPCPQVGDAIDLAVEVEVRKGRLSVSVDKPWSELFAPAKHDQKAA